MLQLDIFIWFTTPLCFNCKWECYHLGRISCKNCQQNSKISQLDVINMTFRIFHNCTCAWIILNYLFINNSSFKINFLFHINVLFVNFFINCYLQTDSFVFLLFIIIIGKVYVNQILSYFDNWLNNYDCFFKIWFYVGGSVLPN